MQLYKKHPANVIRLMLNRDEPGDDEHDNRYTRAAGSCANLAQRGRALHRGQAGALRLPPGVPTTAARRSRVAASWAACGWSGSAKGKIYPHEETHGAAKADRLKLWSGLQGEPQPDLRPLSRSGERRRTETLLEAGDRRPDAARSDRPPGRRPSHVAGDRRAGDHGCRPVHGRPSRSSSPTAIIATRRPATIATSSRRVGRAAKRSARPPGQLRADDVHRHERSGPDRAAHAPPVPRLAGDDRRSTRKLGDSFESEPVGRGPERARSLWEEIEPDDEQARSVCIQRRTVNGHSHDNRRRPSANGRSRQRASDDWQGLGEILHRLIIETLLDAPNLPARSMCATSRKSFKSGSRAMSPAATRPA